MTPRRALWKRLWAHPYGKPLTVLALGLGCSQLAFWLRWDKIGLALAASLAVLSGLAFFGHFITVDDDLPGEWSNPEGSRSQWHASLLEMLAKFFIFFLMSLFMAVHFDR